MENSTHLSYITRGLVVKEKISVDEDSPGEGMRILMNRLETLPSGGEIVGGHLVPEVLSESERLRENIKYYVIYGR